MYLTKEEYVEYGGDTTIDDKLFGNLEYQARKLIDIRTFNRVQDDSPQREAVKRLMFALISLAKEQQDIAADIASGKRVTGYSNDGVSVNYDKAAPLDVTSYSAKQSDLIAEYLMNERSSAGTALLYVGVPTWR